MVARTAGDWGEAGRSGVRIPDQEQSNIGFLELAENLGYRILPPVNVTHGDSTVTPFKEAMAAGEDLESAALVQLCVRAHAEPPWLYRFDMAGCVTGERSFEERVRDAAVLVRRLAP